MIKIKQYIQQHPLQLVAFVVFVILLASSALVYVSIRGLPAQLLKYAQEPPRALQAGTDIAGWASFDRDSYVVGETITYRTQVVYRADRIDPDLDQFVRSVSFLPIEKRGSEQSLRTLANNVNEYTLTLMLQGVDVEPNSNYELDPAVLFYTGVDSDERTLQSIQIPTPTIFFTEYYPQDVSTVPLLPLKKEFDDSYWMRVGVTATCGGILLSLCVLLLWRFGRKRKLSELSEKEKLWQEFRTLEHLNLDKHDYLLTCEKLMIRLLQSCTGLNPRDFWSGINPDDKFWTNITAQMRREFSDNYRPVKATQENVDRVTEQLNNTFSVVVAEDVLIREKEPSFVKRITQQREILAASSACLVLAILMFVLATFPDLWLSRDLLNYNNVVVSLSDPVPVTDESAAFAAIGEQSPINSIRAAALYNAGTIKGHIKPSNNPPLREQELLEVVFQEQLSLDTYIEDDESVEMFFASAGWLLEGKQYLQEAVRADPHDEDIIRNLELVSKRHAAVVAAIKSLFDAMQGENQLKVKTKLETMVDVLNMDWPDEVEEQQEEESYNRTYMISERF